MARVILKPLSQQVVVLTGGTSGIGLVTARCWRNAAPSCS
jgi:NAD(P)-dependent dehydrogenase (short-subunit alcohol dehydrogenase family)